ncbi:unnamed protein product [Rhizoctonia solani]|uniref:Uncharacterized protein n=1 Tax=Rhizoctonia solani TaxID=456999 RepID=A0A8H3BH04_9AGAM|nr:unnamed protein product [Rhizoctonia solani]
MPPKRSASAKSAAPPARKRSRRVVSDDENTPTRSLVSKASTAPKNPMTPSSAPRTSLRKTKTNVPRDDTDEGEGEDEDEDEDEDAEEEDAEEEDEDTNPAPVSKGRKANKTKSKPSITEKDAFSRGFFRVLKPVTNVYYNKESNLIRLRCVEYNTQKSTIEAKSQYFDSRKQYIMALSEEEAQMTDDSLALFRKARADETALALLKVQKDFKALEVSQAKYESDKCNMQTTLEKRNDEEVDRKANAQNAVRLARLAGIRNRMIDGGV